MSDTYLGQTFDSTTVDTSSNFDLVPKGRYMAQVIDGKVEATKAGTGSYLRLQFEIMEGPYERRQVFQNYTLSNPSEKAAEIGRKQLGQLQEAVGVRQISDAKQLFFIPLMIAVSIEKSKDAAYEDSNKVTAYAPVGAGQPPARQQHAAPNAAQSQQRQNDYQPPGNMPPPNAQQGGSPAGAWRNRAR